MEFDLANALELVEQIPTQSNEEADRIKNEIMRNILEHNNGLDEDFSVDNRVDYDWLQMVQRDENAQGLEQRGLGEQLEFRG